MTVSEQHKNKLIAQLQTIQLKLPQSLPSKEKNEFHEKLAVFNAAILLYIDDINARFRSAAINENSLSLEKQFVSELDKAINNLLSPLPDITGLTQSVESLKRISSSPIFTPKTRNLIQSLVFAVVGATLSWAMISPLLFLVIFPAAPYAAIPAAIAYLSTIAILTKFAYNSPTNGPWKEDQKLYDDKSRLAEISEELLLFKAPKQDRRMVAPGNAEHGPAQQPLLKSSTPN